MAATIHPQTIIDDYHRLVKKWGDNRNSADDIQKFVNDWMAFAVLTCSTRRHPSATDEEIGRIELLMQTVKLEWSMRYGMMKTREIFGAPENASEKS